MAAYYVYEHMRKDNGAVFYVGKGKGYRHKSTQGRNKWWWATVNKYGYDSKIRTYLEDEELAHLVEIELIDQYRRTGKKLVNMTDGGEGVSGYKYPNDVVAKRAEKQRGQKRPTVSAKLKGVPKSVEHRLSLSKSKTGTKASQETRLKMSKTRKGRQSAMLGKKHSEEAKHKISKSLLLLPRKTCPYCGKENIDPGNAKRLHFDNCKEKK